MEFTVKTVKTATLKKQKIGFQGQLSLNAGQKYYRIQKIGFQDQLSLKAGQKYCRMLQKEHSAILCTFIQLPFCH